MAKDAECRERTGPPLSDRGSKFHPLEANPHSTTRTRSARNENHIISASRIGRAPSLRLGDRVIKCQLYA